MKQCRKCNKLKPLSSFGYRSDRQKHRARCLQCEADDAADRRALQVAEGKLPQPRWTYRNARSPEDKQRRLRENKLRNRYGITVEDYEKMSEHQAFRCAICRTEGALVVDHNHETGTVRELLCSLCNVALAFVKEDIDTLKAMIAYVERHTS